MTLATFNSNRLSRLLFTISLLVILGLPSVARGQAGDYYVQHIFSIHTPGNMPPAVFLKYRTETYAETNWCNDGYLMEDIAAIGLAPVSFPNNADAPDSTAYADAGAHVYSLVPGFVSGDYWVAGAARPSISGCAPPSPPYGRAFSRASSKSQILVRGTKEDRNGTITFAGKWVTTTPVSGKTRRRISRDPIRAHLTDLTTGITTDYTLLTIDASVGSGDFSWRDGLLHTTSANFTFDLKLGSPVIIQAGTIHIEINDGVVTSSSSTGMFAGMALPGVGSSGGFTVPLPEITLDYNLGGDPTHDLQPELDFENGGETEKPLNSAGDCGSLCTGVGEGAGDSNISKLPAGDSSLGFDVGVSRFHIADDFTVAPNTAVTLDSVMCPVYQPNAAPTMPLSAAFVRIWRGMPGTGGVPIAGDMFTNRLIHSDFADMYRVSTNPLDGSRAIKNALLDLSWVPPLQTGQYWIEFACEGWTGQNLGVASAPACVWRSSADNARRFNVQTNQWLPVTDAQSQRPLGFPFQVFGYTQNLIQPCPPDIAPPGQPNGMVNIDDLVMVISNFGAQGGPADINHDGIVNIDDLVQVIIHWGNC